MSESPQVPELITQSAFAERWGVSRQWIGQLVKSGRLPSRDGKVEKVAGDATMRERQPRVSDTEANGGEQADYQEARARREAAQAELAELELRRKRGEFLDRAEAEREIMEVCQTVKEKLAARNRKLGPQLAAEADGREITRILDEADRDVLHDIANTLEGK